MGHLPKIVPYPNCAHRHFTLHYFKIRLQYVFPREKLQIWLHFLSVLCKYITSHRKSKHISEATSVFFLSRDMYNSCFSCKNCRVKAIWCIFWVINGSNKEISDLQGIHALLKFLFLFWRFNTYQHLIRQGLVDIKPLGNIRILKNKTRRQFLFF